VHRLKFKWFLPVLAVAVIVAVSLMVFLPPKVTITGEGMLSISNRVVIAAEAPQIDIVSISNIPAYGVIEPSGCGEFKGKVKIRIDMYMTPDSPYYNDYYVQVIDTTSKEYLRGYKGKLDAGGNPIDPVAYQNWLDSLPTIWQENAFHTHFVYFDSTVSDAQIQAKVASTTEYFYAFYKYCIDNKLDFLTEWKLVPKQIGAVRDVFVAGDSSALTEQACETKATDITLRTTDFDTRFLVVVGGVPPPLNIGEKGTIDIGSPAISRALATGIINNTRVEKGNPANADGNIDTAEIYLYSDTGTLDVYFGTFSAAGDVLTCRDSESVGDVVKGAKRTFTGLTIAVITGDYWGVCSKSGTEANLYSDNSGGVGWWYYNGEVIDPTDSETFSLVANRILSLYGTGTEAGGEPEVTNIPNTWSPSIIEVNTNTYTAINYFTITNTGTGAVDVTIQGTDLDNVGSTAWDLADDGDPGVNIYGLWAGLDDGDDLFDVIVAESTANTLLTGLAELGTQDWGMKIYMPTSVTGYDGLPMTSVVTLVASAAS